MVAKVIGIGNKVEFTKIQPVQNNDENAGIKKKIYVSQVYDIVDDTRIKVSMPIENGHVVALAPNTRLDACFYTKKGLYHGRIVVVERMKEDNLHVMIIELQYELKKFQRRQYYRLSCTMDLQYRLMEDEEISRFIEKKELPYVDEVHNLKYGVALDFSGGGVRFISDTKYSKNNLMFIRLEISYDEESRLYLLVGRVVTSTEGKNGRNNYENRVEFLEMENKVREEIIRYIFREERRQRKMLSEDRLDD